MVTDSLLLSNIDAALDGFKAGPSPEDYIVVGTYFKQGRELFENFATGKVDVDFFLVEHKNIGRKLLSHAEIFNTSEELEVRIKDLFPKKEVKRLLNHEKEHAERAKEFYLHTKWCFYKGEITPGFAGIFYPNYSENVKTFGWGRREILVSQQYILDIPNAGAYDKLIRNIALNGITLINQGRIPA
jgi:hypothetical protein